MIQCIINGNAVYPDLKSNIKVTYENQYIKDSGQYTYTINFPMSITENRQFFRHVCRFDVRKKIPDYEDCKLLVDNRMVISGKGTVIGITNQVVKLQIVGGKSRIKYNAKMATHYIDELEYPKTLATTQMILDRGVGIKRTIDKALKIDLSSSHIVGREGEFAFNPVYDETNDIIANRIIVNEKKGVYDAYMMDVAVQPYLFYVLRKAIEAEGFRIRRNDFDIDPWNRLVICNARKTTDIRFALPHWSVYTFIEEVRKLFNASFVFDEKNKEVDILMVSELTTTPTVTYEKADEFTTEYDEEGLVNLAVSNIEYGFGDSIERNYLEVIPDQVLQKFPIREFQTLSEMMNAAEAMTQKERMTTIFKLPEIYYVFTLDDNKVEKAEMAGFFNPYIRDHNSDDSVKLNISPVGMMTRNLWNRYTPETPSVYDVQDHIKVTIPSISNDKEADLQNLTFDDEKDEYYISVQDAIQDSTVVENKEENTEEKMQVMFQSKGCYNYHTRQIEYPETQGAGSCPYFRHPTVLTDYRMYPWMNANETASMALHQLPYKITIGDYIDNIALDKHNSVCIKFFTNDIPDPSWTYIFGNKKFLCQKIEIECNEGGISEEKVGYFNELS